MHGQYILVNRKPILCDDFMVWGRWFEKARCTGRRVRQTYINDIRVSTVFLGLDHGWGEGEPILFETMIFGILRKGVDEQLYQERCCTHRQALDMHWEAVDYAKRISQIKLVA